MTTNAAAHDNAYAFSFKTLVGHKPLPLEAYKGRVILVVNTASKCGFTPQYKGLEALYKHYKERGLVIIGVPSNDFGSQEPGTEQEVAHFCQINYGVTFPMTAKEVVSGKDAHPFYLWAKKELGFDTAPKWNFHKYLINRKGELIDYFYSTTSPEAPRLIKSVEKALAD
jgi:glutathione peroxidase